MTVEELKQEVNLLTLKNIKTYPCSITQKFDFYELWQRFGPECARLYMMPSLWEGKLPLPSTVLS